MQEKEFTEIFREEYSNLVAVLFHYYRMHDVQLAEDIVSDTFISAMKSWSHHGVPESPRAWLRKVAKNKWLDHQKRRKIYSDKIVPHLMQGDGVAQSSEITDEVIEDSQLRMIFVVCDPTLSSDAQICLALRILCGFNIEEIASAFFSNKDTINKKLYRAKKSIKKQEHLSTQLTVDQYSARLDNVLRVIYLLFSEGYYSSINEENIRQDICWNAMRLGLFLAKQEIFPQPRIRALIALMCFHASRLAARSSGKNGDLVYHQQDKSKWDWKLIEKGNHFLNLAAQGGTLSKYHFEAAIAYWHTVEDESKWDRILELYNKLLMLEYSPMIALNRTYALARANSVSEAIREAHKLSLDNSHLYYCLLAELYSMDHNREKAEKALGKALTLAKRNSERELIREKMRNLPTAP